MERDSADRGVLPNVPFLQSSHSAVLHTTTLIVCLCVYDNCHVIRLKRADGRLTRSQREDVYCDAN